MGRPCSFDKTEAMFLARNGLTNRQIADQLHANPNSVGQILRANGIFRYMRQSQAVSLRIPRHIWKPLAMEAEKRGMYTSTFIANLLRIIMTDNLLNAILDDNSQDIPKNVLTSPHICGIIHPTSSRKASA